jgi:hypothetical protein
MKTRFGIHFILEEKNISSGTIKRIDERFKILEFIIDF